MGRLGIKGDRWSAQPQGENRVRIFGCTVPGEPGLGDGLLRLADPRADLIFILLAQNAGHRTNVRPSKTIRRTTGVDFARHITDVML